MLYLYDSFGGPLQLGVVLVSIPFIRKVVFYCVTLCQVKSDRVYNLHYISNASYILCTTQMYSIQVYTYRYPISIIELAERIKYPVSISYHHLHASISDI